MLYYNRSLIIKILFREAWRQPNFLISIESISFLKENVKHRGHRDPQRTQRYLLFPLCLRKRLCVFVFQNGYVLKTHSVCSFYLFSVFSVPLWFGYALLILKDVQRFTNVNMDEKEQGNAKQI